MEASTTPGNSNLKGDILCEGISFTPWGVSDRQACPSFQSSQVLNVIISLGTKEVAYALREIDQILSGG